MKFSVMYENIILTPNICSDIMNAHNSQTHVRFLPFPHLGIGRLTSTDGLIFSELDCKREAGGIES